MKKNRVRSNILFIAIVIINISSIINGARHHETWLIVVGSASMALILTAGIINLVKASRQKNKQVS